MEKKKLDGYKAFENLKTLQLKKMVAFRKKHWKIISQWLKMEEELASLTSQSTKYLLNKSENLMQQSKQT